MIEDSKNRQHSRERSANGVKQKTTTQEEKNLKHQQQQQQQSNRANERKKEDDEASESSVSLSSGEIECDARVKGENKKKNKKQHEDEGSSANDDDSYVLDLNDRLAQLGRSDSLLETSEDADAPPSPVLALNQGSKQSPEQQQHTEKFSNAWHTNKNYIPATAKSIDTTKQVECETTGTKEKEEDKARVPEHELGDEAQKEKQGCRMLEQFLTSHKIQLNDSMGTLDNSSGASSSLSFEDSPSNQHKSGDSNNDQPLLGWHDMSTGVPVADFVSERDLRLVNWRLLAARLAMWSTSSSPSSDSELDLLDCESPALAMACSDDTSCSSVELIWTRPTGPRTTTATGAPTAPGAAVSRASVVPARKLSASSQAPIKRPLATPSPVLKQQVPVMTIRAAGSPQRLSILELAKPSRAKGKRVGQVRPRSLAEKKAGAGGWIANPLFASDDLAVAPSGCSDQDCDCAGQVYLIGDESYSESQGKKVKKEERAPRGVASGRAKDVNEVNNEPIVCPSLKSADATTAPANFAQRPKEQLKEQREQEEQQRRRQQEQHAQRQLLRLSSPNAIACSVNNAHGRVALSAANDEEQVKVETSSYLSDNRRDNIYLSHILNLDKKIKSNVSSLRNQLSLKLSDTGKRASILADQLITSIKDTTKETTAELFGTSASRANSRDRSLENNSFAPPREANLADADAHEANKKARLFSLIYMHQQQPNGQPVITRQPQPSGGLGAPTFSQVATSPKQSQQQQQQQQQEPPPRPPAPVGSVRRLAAAGSLLANPSEPSKLPESNQGPGSSSAEVLTANASPLSEVSSPLDESTVESGGQVVRAKGATSAGNQEGVAEKHDQEAPIDLRVGKECDLKQLSDQHQGDSSRECPIDSSLNNKSNFEAKIKVRKARRFRRLRPPINRPASSSSSDDADDCEQEFYLKEYARFRTLVNSQSVSRGSENSEKSRRLRLRSLNYWRRIRQRKLDAANTV